jgi:hypothetical protein
MFDSAAAAAAAHCPQMRGRLAIWHMRPLPPEAAGIGSSFDLPVVSPLGMLHPRTPAAAAAAAGTFGSPFGGSASGFGSTGAFGSAGRFAGSAAGYSSGGLGGGVLGAAAAAAAAGGAAGTAAYSSSLLGPIVAGGTPRTAMSVGAGSTARR